MFMRQKYTNTRAKYHLCSLKHIVQLSKKVAGMTIELTDNGRTTVRKAILQSDDTRLTSLYKRFLLVLIVWGFTCPPVTLRFRGG